MLTQSEQETCIAFFSVDVLMCCKACLTCPLAALNCICVSGIAEVMSLVTSLGPEEATARQEVTGPTDPLRVLISHTLHPEARCVSFTVELLNRLTADIKTLVLRLVGSIFKLLLFAVCLQDALL